jgi:hypothetical protein
MWYNVTMNETLPRTSKSFNPEPGVIVRPTVNGYSHLTGKVIAVREATGTLPTIIAVDLGPNRQVDFQPHELIVVVDPRDVEHRLTGDLHFYHTDDLLAIQAKVTHELRMRGEL